MPGLASSYANVPPKQVPPQQYFVGTLSLHHGLKRNRAKDKQPHPPTPNTRMIIDAANSEESLAIQGYGSQRVRECIVTHYSKTLVHSFIGTLVFVTNVEFFHTIP